MTNLATAFVLAHPGDSSAIIEPRVIEQLDDLLAGADVTLDGDVLDQIDQIVAPGTDLGSFRMAYTPPALADPNLQRRRP